MSAKNMLYISYNGRICDFLSKLQKSYFAILIWRYMAEMHLFEQPLFSGIIIFKFEVKKFIMHRFCGLFCAPIWYITFSCTNFRESTLIHTYLTRVFAFTCCRMPLICSQLCGKRRNRLKLESR